MSAATADYTPRKPASRFSASATSATTTTAGPDAPTTNARSHLHRHSASMPPPPPPSLSSSITTTPHGGSNNSRATTTMSLRSSTSARAPTWPTPSSRIAGANASNNHTASPPIPASPAPTSTTTLGLTPFATPAAAPRTRSSTTGSMHTGFGSSKSGSALRPSVRATPAPPSAPSGLPQSTGGLRSKRDVRGSGKPVPPTPARGASTASAHARAMYAPAMPLSPAPRLGSFIAADPRRGANSSTVSGISSHGIVGARRSSVPMATTPGPGELPTLPNLLTSAYFDRVEAEIAARSAIDRPGSVNSGPSFENGFDQYNLPAALPYPFVRPPPPLADLDDPAARDYFGAHFRVERALGRGSFSTVSSAVCTRHALSPWPAHDQAVAVKVPTKPYTSWRHRARMIEEVRVMRRLGVRGGHPNVLALHAAWEQRGALFLVLELCAGGTLAEHLERRAAVGLSETEIWAVLSDVAEGLAFIHARGVAHLDVKPANILLTVHGTCKIGDFGLAVPADELERMQRDRQRRHHHRRNGQPPISAEGDPLAPEAGGDEDEMEGNQLASFLSLSQTIRTVAAAASPPVGGGGGAAVNWVPDDRDGDAMYAAPEAVHGVFGLASDVFAYGLIALEMVWNVQLPHGGEPIYDTLRRGMFDALMPPGGRALSPSMRSLLGVCLVPTPAFRTTFDRIRCAPEMVQVRVAREALLAAEGHESRAEAAALEHQATLQDSAWSTGSSGVSGVHAGTTGLGASSSISDAMDTTPAHTPHKNIVVDASPTLTTTTATSNGQSKWPDGAPSGWSVAARRSLQHQDTVGPHTPSRGVQSAARTPFTVGGGLLAPTPFRFGFGFGSPAFEPQPAVATCVASGGTLTFNPGESLASPPPPPMPSAGHHHYSQQHQLQEFSTEFSGISPAAAGDGGHRRWSSSGQDSNVRPAPTASSLLATRPGSRSSSTGSSPFDESSGGDDDMGDSPLAARHGSKLMRSGSFQLQLPQPTAAWNTPIKGSGALSSQQQQQPHHRLRWPTPSGRLFGTSAPSLDAPPPSDAM